MISAIRHVGIVVRDLEKSLTFYSGILGLEIYKRCIEEGPFIEQLTGHKNVKLEWVKLIIPKGGLVELLQYHSPTDPEAASPPKPYPSNGLGCSHAALTVSNLDEICAKMEKHGYSAKSPPLTTDNKAAKVVYCHDPDGVILELIEDL
jgi:catechol 2,3-dioxygenase-like lactoylglutathione lyase family enzyme